MVSLSKKWGYSFRKKNSGKILLFDICKRVFNLCTSFFLRNLRILLYFELVVNTPNVKWISIKIITFYKPQSATRCPIFVTGGPRGCNLSGFRQTCRSHSSRSQVIDNRPSKFRSVQVNYIITGFEIDPRDTKRY